jgi:hypothetical protein
MAGIFMCPMSFLGRSRPNAEISNASQPPRRGRSGSTHDSGQPRSWAALTGVNYFYRLRRQLSLPVTAHLVAVVKPSRESGRAAARRLRRTGKDHFRRPVVVVVSLTGGRSATGIRAQLKLACASHRVRPGRETRIESRRASWRGRQPLEEYAAAR